MSQLLLVSVGPVQDFIRTARRTRDLWFGSWLLSEVSKAAARALAESGASLVFPALERGATELARGSDFNVGNVVLAQVASDPAQLASLARDAARAEIGHLWARARRQITGSLNEESASAQIEDLLELSWVAVPVQHDGYAAARQRASTLLAARKSTRDFQPATWGANYPKSSLDGARESVIPEGEYAGANAHERLRRHYGARGAERLSGVDLLKRHGGRAGDARFFSTSHVAALPTLARLTGAHRPALEHYVQILHDLGLAKDDLDTVPRAHPVFERLDGHILFEERLAEYLVDTSKLADARKALTAFFTATGLRRPSPYYALLVADGDRMGATIDRLKEADDQRKLSRALAGFASQAKRIVETEHGGELVYAGGDDVIAFVGLHQALAAARALADAFTAALAKFPGDDGRAPTLSVGLAVCHHLEPLQDALELARGAERAAKSVPGKNALALTLAKRGGAEFTVSGSWAPPEAGLEPLDARLAAFASLHRRDALPDGAGYELRELARTLRELPDALAIEAKRILGRKRAQGGSARVSDDDRRTLERTLDAGLSVTALADELIVARLLATAAPEPTTREPA